jgi:hypothetical protein
MANIRNQKAIKQTTNAAGLQPTQNNPTQGW